jgi:hypothetical protein
MIDERVLNNVALGRRRFIAKAGVALTGVGMKLFFPGSALAVIPNGCYGYDGCDCCNGNVCCRSDCRSGYYGCSSGSQCWQTCSYEGSTLVRIQCCDWGTSGNPCICRLILGPC